MGYKSVFSWAHRLGDVLFIIACLGLLVEFFSVDWTDRYMVAGLAAAFCYSTIAQYLGLYEGWRGRSLAMSLNKVSKGWLLSVTVVLGAMFFFDYLKDFSRQVLMVWVPSVLVLLCFMRWLVRLLLTYARQRGFNRRRVAIIGEGEVADKLARTMNTSLWLGMDLAHRFGSNQRKECVQFAKESKFDCLYIALPLRRVKLINYLMDELSDSSVSIHFVPDMLGLELLHSSWTEINTIPIVHLQDSPIRGVNSLLKRVEDVVLSSLILLLISPVLLCTALAIKLTSPGPVVFVQERYGLNGRMIRVYKFRSMKLRTANDDGVDVKKNDDRVTKVGAFIRRTSIDELPQFVNVLQGRMSIVGPRPHAKGFNDNYRAVAPSYMRRHLVKPGITGWAQVNGWRGETDTDEKILKRTEFDLYYIQNWSIWLDLKIIFLTIFKGFVNKNAY